MPKFHRKSGGGGKGGGIKSRATNFMAPFMISILGGIAVLISLAMFTLTIGQIDSDITLVLTYPEQASSIQLVSPLTIVIFLASLTVGIGLLTAGGIGAGKRAAAGGMMEIFLAIVMAGVAGYIAFVMYGMSATQLHTAWTTVNASVNKSYFTSTLSVMGVGGILLLVGFVSNAMSSLVGAGIGGYKIAKDMF